MAQKPDLFETHAKETSWEWAWARRKVFTSPLKDFIGACVAAFFVGLYRYGAGDSGLRIAIIASLIVVASAFALPRVEALIWLARRRSILLDEREDAFARREATSVPVISHAPAAVPVPDRPRAEVEFICGTNGWARLRITNPGPGAMFSATIQTYGLTAGAVEGCLIAARWEETPAAEQWIAPADTRVLRLASVVEIVPGVRAWAVHRAGADDIRAVELVESLDATVVANPDLAQPCRLRFLLDVNGQSRMSRIGVDPPLECVVPSRVAHMRRLLVEVADYVRAMPYGLGNAKVAIPMSLTVKFKVAELVRQAFGAGEEAAYAAAFPDTLHPTLWQETSAAFLLDLGQRMTEGDISPTFMLPITWVEFYAQQPDWEWPEYDD